MRRLIATLLIGLPLAGFAADRPRDLQPLPDAPPPPPGVVADDEAPQIIIRKSGEARIEEYRIHGKLYMIKITPAVGKPYYLVDERGDGRFSRQDHLDSGVRPPMWLIHEW